ncbi:uncharacterized protein PG986_009370 [Apiospora aurea]|uniref:Uncharacterized protein n=1 Tax=Apiospora aurea TaxID=335848 RepID=A0ABR1Q7H5_9PEZI
MACRPPRRETFEPVPYDEQSAEKSDDSFDSHSDLDHSIREAKIPLPLPAPTPTPSTPDTTTNTTTTPARKTEATSNVPTTSSPKAKGWWEEAARTTCAWTKLADALSLTPEQTATLLAAKPVESTLWAYDERFLQPRLRATTTTTDGSATKRQPSSWQDRVKHVVPVGASAYNHPEVHALWVTHFTETAARLRSDPRYLGRLQHVHASLAAWRILLWLWDNDEARALGLGGPLDWGTAVHVVGVLLEYIYDFEDENGL